MSSQACGFPASTLASKIAASLVFHRLNCCVIFLGWLRGKCIFCMNVTGLEGV